MNGLRFNKGKARWDLLPWEAVGKVVNVLTLGAVKYAARNWEKGLSYQDTFASLQRHAIAWFNGEDMDSESGEHHMAHVACNALFLLWFSIKGRGTDDRPNTNTGVETTELRDRIASVCARDDLPAGTIVPLPHGYSFADVGITLRD